MDNASWTTRLLENTDDIPCPPLGWQALFDWRFSIFDWRLGIGDWGLAIGEGRHGEAHAIFG